ncbi:MAG: efflux RND transporter periplasmic adaptor subunit [Gammaproteobacteria bacterium]
MKQLVAGLALGLVAGAVVAWLYFAQTPPPVAQPPGTSATPRREPLFYRNPMNPAITSPTPAKDDMGMDYLPVYADDTAAPAAPAGTVTIDPRTRQSIGVRTQEAERRTLARQIRAVGRVVYDEREVRRLHPKTEGWIEELYIDETGVAVANDTILLSLYSPQLVATQQEYLLALRNREIFADNPIDDIREGARALIASARERLRLLDVPAHQIRELEQTREIKKSLHIHSPYRGIVVSIGVREGQYVTAQTELYTIADLSHVWVHAEIYADDMPWVAEGDPATITVEGIPGETFRGSVTHIYPYLESRARTVRVRLEFDNPGLRLKPDMYAEVSIAAQRQVDAVTVPSAAIVRSGTRELVFVAQPGGHFEPREVTLGVSAGGLTQVTAGIAAGEAVVTSGQFLIDSESKLREATAKMVDGMAGDTSAPAEPAQTAVNAHETHRGLATGAVRAGGQTGSDGHHGRDAADGTSPPPMSHEDSP